MFSDAGALPAWVEAFIFALIIVLYSYRVIVRFMVRRARRREF